MQRMNYYESVAPSLKLEGSTQPLVTLSCIDVAISNQIAQDLLG